MKLITKFNLVLTGVLTISLAGTAILSYTLLQKHAREEIIHRAGIMMEAASAIRNYTASEIRPLLAPQMEQNFLPQSVPAYAAATSFNQLKKAYPEYHYKEATTNPTNPDNLAVDWENDIIQQFRDRAGLNELVGIRTTPAGNSLYLARPIYVKNKACLSCHGQAANAPKSMVAKYGEVNGFGWKLHGVIGAQIISVPMSASVEKVRQAFYTFMAAVIGIFVITIVILNIMLHRIVIRPVTRMATIADQISLGKLDAPEFNETGKDEVSILGASFNRLRRSLEKAIKMLEGGNI